MVKRRKNIWPFETTTTVYRRRGVSPRQSKATSHKGYRVWDDEDGWHTSLDPGSWFDTRKDVTRFIDSWIKGRSNPHLMSGQSSRYPGFHPNPPEGWFQRCVKAVSAKGGAYDPNAVCATQERRSGKRNALGLASIPGLGDMAAKKSEKWLKRHKLMNPTKTWHVHSAYDGKYLGRVKAEDKAEATTIALEKFGNSHVSLKRNPEPEASEAFEKFHGFPPREEIVVDRDVHFHERLWAVGELEKLTVIAIDGGRVDLSGFADNKGEPAMLCGNERMTQLYIEGGDQEVDLAEFEIGEPYHDKEELGKIKKLFYFTDKTHLGDQGGEAVYHHKLGEEKKTRMGLRIVVQPTLVYDVRNKALEIIGGEYVIEPEGIRN